MPQPETPSPAIRPATSITAAGLLGDQALALTRRHRRVGARGPSGLPGVRLAIRSKLRELFGVPSFGQRGDTSTLAAVDGPSWYLLAEPAAIAGGIRSLLVQALHPLAMAGVADHSRYRADPLARLEGTSTWVTVSTFGSLQRIREEATRVRAMHRRVVGTTSDGRAYRASDERLLVWVSVALTSSFLATHRLFAPADVVIDEDRFVAEQARAAALLDPRVDLDEMSDEELAMGGPDVLPLLGALPQTEAALRALLGDFARSELQITPAAVEAMRFLRAVELPRGATLPYRLILNGVASTLPHPAARALGFTPSDRDVRRLGVFMTTMRAVTGRSPSWQRAHDRISATPPGTADFSPG